MPEKRRKRAKRTQDAPQPPQKQPAPPGLKLLITVVNREKADAYLALLRLYDSNLQLATAARGTASAEMLRYLGLTDSEKAVLFSVIRADRAADALRFLEQQFRTMKHGKGIAFTVPFASMIGVSGYRFLSNGTGTGL